MKKLSNSHNTSVKLFAVVKPNGSITMDPFYLKKAETKILKMGKHQRKKAG